MGRWRRRSAVAWGDLMIRLKDELAFLEKQLPELERRADLAQLADEFKKRIANIRREIHALENHQDSK
jgi:hypothetical protein